MSNAIQYALKSINQDIPKAILQLTFNDATFNRFAITVSTDSRIRDEVIQQRVMADMNSVGGTEITLALRNADCEMLDPGVYVYRIPPSLTQNRMITSALSVAFSHRAQSLQGYVGDGNQINAAMSQMRAGVSGIPYVSDARCSVIGNNVVMVQHQNIGAQDLYLRCIVENDANLNHLHRTTWLDFAELCIYAVKAEVYMRNVIPLDEAYMSGGQSIGAYKDIIDSYSDANQTYKDFLKSKFAKILLMNDPVQHERWIRLTGVGIN